MTDAPILPERTAPQPAAEGPTDVPESYDRAQAEILSLLAPSNFLERHYAEKIAAASWRLERLRRWQARLFEDPSLTEDERLTKLEKPLRHETSLNRQVDTAVKMLVHDVPRLCADRACPDTRPPCPTEPAAGVAPPGVRLSSERDSSPRASLPRDTNGKRQDKLAPAPSATPPLPVSGGVTSLRGGVGSSSVVSLTLTAKGRLVPARADAARRLLFSS